MSGSGWGESSTQGDKRSCAHRKRLHVSYFCNAKLFKWLSLVSVSGWTERCSSRSLTSLSITTVDVFWTGIPEEKHKERQWTDFQNAGDNANSHVYDGESGWTGKATHWIISLCICHLWSTNQPNPVQLTEIVFIASYARHYELWQKCKIDKNDKSTKYSTGKYHNYYICFILYRSFSHLDMRDNMHLFKRALEHMDKRRLFINSLA